MEQLEGFQNQELAKVKHMLLSAETALDQERRRRKELEESAPVKSGGEDVEELRKKLQELEVRLLDRKTILSYRYGQHNKPNFQFNHQLSSNLFEIIPFAQSPLTFRSSSALLRPASAPPPGRLRRGPGCRRWETTQRG